MAWISDSIKVAGTVVIIHLLFCSQFYPFGVMDAVKPGEGMTTKLTRRLVRRLLVAFGLVGLFRL